MIESRQELAEFCLRQLGGGVINIEVSDDQLEDCIDMAVEYYREYHYDGIERDFIRCLVTATQITIPNTSALTVGMVVTGKTSGAISAITKIVSSTVFEVSRITNLKMFGSTELVTINSVDYQVSKVVAGSLDTGYFEIDDTVVGILKILNVSSIINSSTYLFDPKFQMMQAMLSNMGNMNVQYFYGAMQYLSELDFLLRKEKSFRFNRRMNRLNLDIDWNTDVAAGDILVVEVNRYVDDEIYSEVLNDRWLRAYSTALIKKQWGTNLSKYDGIQLPGGLRYSGKQMYQEAMEEIAKLEQDIIDSEEPLLFMVG